MASRQFVTNSWALTLKVQQVWVDPGNLLLVSLTILK